MRYITLFLFFWITATLQAQTKQDKKVIQFSGVVVTADEFGEMVPLPYTTVSIAGTSRGTYAEIDGFFSIVAEVGDTMVFSRIGFATAEHIVQDSLTESFYSWYQIMTEDDVMLPEAVIYPWPDRDFYKIEFLALDVTDELRTKAEQNLAQEILQRMQSSVAPDGENAFELAQMKQQLEYQYAGQYKPQKIFDVVAWSQFIKAWKNGDFKKKKKKIK